MELSFTLPTYVGPSSVSTSSPILASGRPACSFSPTSRTRAVVKALEISFEHEKDNRRAPKHMRLRSAFLDSGRAVSFFAPVRSSFLPESNLFPCAGRWTMMPMSVPKVLVENYREGDGQMMDIYNALYKSRCIFLGEEIDDEVANQIIAVLLHMDSENQGPITMFINSPGGYVTSGLALYDTMRHCQSQIATLCVGTAASMASFLLSGGHKGYRGALTHARIMLHQPSGGAKGQVDDLKIEVEQVRRIRDTLYQMYSEHTGHPIDKIIKDLDRDFYLTAHEAREYGLIDKVIQPKQYQVKDDAPAPEPAAA